MARGGIPRRRGTSLLGAPAQVSPATAAAPFAAAAQAVRPFEAEAERQFKLQQRRSLNAAQTAFTEAANRVQLQYADDVNPDVEAFQDDYDTAVSAVLDGIADVDVREAVSESAGRHGRSVAADFLAKRSEFATQTRLVDLDSYIQQQQAAYGLADSDDGRREISKNIEVAIQFAEVEGDLIDPLEAEGRRALSRQREGKSYAQRLIRTNPFAALAALQDKDNEFLRGMEPGLRLQLERSAEVEIQRLQTAAAELTRLHKEAVASDFLERIYTPAHAEGFPTLAEVFDSDLDPRTQEHFAKLITASAQGVDINFTDEALTNELWRRVHDPLHPQPITQAFQLLPFVGNGLSRENRDKLEVDIETLKKDPLEQSRDAIWKDLMDLGDAQISSGTLVRKDPVGEGKFFDFRVLAESERLRLRKDGKSPEEIVQSVRRLIPQFVRSDIERARDLSAQILQDSDAADAVPQRLDGETPEQALKRIGLD